MALDERRDRTLTIATKPPQVQAKDGLINVLKFAAEGVLDPDAQTTAMVKRCVFEVLLAYYYTVSAKS